METPITHISKGTCTDNLIVIQFISFYLTLLVYIANLITYMSMGTCYNHLIVYMVKFISSHIGVTYNPLSYISKGNVKWFVDRDKFCKMDSVLKIFHYNINICV